MTQRVQDAYGAVSKSYEEFAKEIDEYLALMERTKIDKSEAERTDESYYLPMASYPMKMEKEIKEAKEQE